MLSLYEIKSSLLDPSTNWMSNEVRRAIRKRDRCFKKFQRTRRDEDKLLHIIARREANKLKREAKNRYENNI